MGPFIGAAMITYPPRSQVGFLAFMARMCRIAVSLGCVTFAFKIAAITASITALVKFFDFYVWEDILERTLPNQVIYTGLYGLVSFAVVFHTSHSYQRFMDGMGLLYQIVGDFLDVTSLLMCFSKASNASDKDKIEFQNTLVRLFSLQFMVCLGHLEDKDETTSKLAHTLDLIDPDGLDDATLKIIVASADKPSAVYQRILDLMMHAYNSGVITAPAPLYTRCFQELGNGMIKFHEATLFVEVPFPLPYTTISEILLVVFTFMTPFFTALWSTWVIPAAFYAFCPIFALWLLQGVSEELDNPFNGDSTDVDSIEMLELFNERLCSLLGHRTVAPPGVSSRAKDSLPSRWKDDPRRTSKQAFRSLVDMSVSPTLSVKYKKSYSDILHRVEVQFDHEEEDDLEVGVTGELEGSLTEAEVAQEALSSEYAVVKPESRDASSGEQTGPSDEIIYPLHRDENWEIDTSDPVRGRDKPRVSFEDSSGQPAEKEVSQIIDIDDVALEPPRGNQYSNAISRPPGRKGHDGGTMAGLEYQETGISGLRLVLPTG